MLFFTRLKRFFNKLYKKHMKNIEFRSYNNNNNKIIFDKIRLKNSSLSFLFIYNTKTNFNQFKSRSLYRERLDLEIQLGIMPVEVVSRRK